MLASSLSKFFNVTKTDDGRFLFWGLADKFGVPLRATGPILPLRPQDMRTVVKLVVDYKAGFFDTDDPKQLEQYCEILARVECGWYALRAKTLFARGSSHYIEWIERYAEVDQLLLVRNMPTMHVQPPPESPGYSLATPGPRPVPAGSDQ